MREEIRGAALASRRTERLLVILVVLVALALLVICSIPLGEGFFLPPASANCVRAGPEWTRSGGSTVGWLGWLRWLLRMEDDQHGRAHGGGYILSNSASGVVLWGVECTRVATAEYTSAAVRVAGAAARRSLLLEKAVMLVREIGTAYADTVAPAAEHLRAWWFQQHRSVRV